MYDTQTLPLMNHKRFMKLLSQFRFIADLERITGLKRRSFERKRDKETSTQVKDSDLLLMERALQLYEDRLLNAVAKALCREHAKGLAICKDKEQLLDMPPVEKYVEEHWEEFREKAQVLLDEVHAVE